MSKHLSRVSSASVSNKRPRFDVLPAPKTEPVDLEEYNASGPLIVPGSKAATAMDAAAAAGGSGDAIKGTAIIRAGSGPRVGGGGPPGGPGGGGPPGALVDDDGDDYSDYSDGNSDYSDYQCHIPDNDGGGSDNRIYNYNYQRYYTKIVKVSLCDHVVIGGGNVRLP